MKTHGVIDILKYNCLFSNQEIGKKSASFCFMNNSSLCSLLENGKTNHTDGK